MTISSTNNRVSYTGNGSTGTYAYTFRIFDEDDLTWLVQEIATGTETTLTIGTDYTVTGVNALAGGTMVLVDNNQAWLDSSGFLTSSYKLIGRRKLDILQPTDIRNQGTFFPESHENAFDRFIMIDQQQQDEIDRSIRTAESEGALGATLPVAAERANQFLAFDADGDPIVASAVTGVVASAFAQTLLDDTSAAAARTTLGLDAAAAASKKVGVGNIGFQNFTTSTTNDSLRLFGSDGTTLSSTNRITAGIPSATAGQIAELFQSANVTFAMNGVTFGYSANTTDILLTIYAINDAGTLKFGISPIANLEIVLDADDQATASNAITYQSVYVSSALTGDSYCVAAGYVRANFTASGSVWDFQISTGDLNPTRLDDSEYLRAPSANIACNPQFRYWNNATAAGVTRNDDLYFADIWTSLCSANDVTVTRVTTPVAPGARYGVQCDKTTTGGQFGIVQFFSGNDSIPVRGRPMTFSIHAATSTTEIATVKVAILSWAGSEDGLTSDVVSSWAATPTYAANWTQIATATLTLSTTMQQVYCTGIVPATCNNLAIFVYTPTSESTNDTLFLSGADFYVGNRPRTFVTPDNALDLIRIQRHYETNYDLGVIPSTSTTTGSEQTIACAGSLVFPIKFKVTKNAAPTITPFSTTGASGNVRDLTSAADVAATIGSSGNAGGVLSVTTTDGRQYGWYWVADARL